jgi:hypothetical protein
MINLDLSFKRLLTFRLQVHASFTFRADALFELIEAVLLTPIIRSAIEVSTSPAFRRRFASVYDALRHGCLDRTRLRAALTAAEPEDAITVGGYAVYATDSTCHLRPDAETLPDRGKVYSAEHGKAVPGHQFSWLGRIVARGQSWFAPREVDRIPTARTPAAVAAEQVKTLAAEATPTAPKVVVGDSRYAQRPFLGVFVGLAHVHALVRLACNRVLYGPPPPKTGKPGRPKAHGAKFRLKAPPSPERQSEINLCGHVVRLSAWWNLHFKALPQLIGLVLRVEFLKADGTPRYQRPLWLFWSGPSDIALGDLVVIYLLRFGIEHFFRFLKQHLGLLAVHVTDLIAVENWVWVVALAYWQLLLARTLVTPEYRPWDPAARRQAPYLTPGQVRQAWGAFSRGLGTPAAAPRPAGKAPGRAVGFQPRPRPRYAVVKKGQVTAVATA